MLALKIIFLACSIAVCHCEFVFNMKDTTDAFTACDKNKDQKINLVEFKEFIKGGGIKHVAIKRKLLEEELTAIFNMMDVSNDQNLDEREWGMGMSLYLEFSSYDANQDQFIDADELVNLFNAPNGPGGNDIVFVEFLARIINDLRLHYKN